MDGSGARRGNVQSGPLDLAAAAAAGRKVIVLVPGTDALLAEPVLPVKSGAKLAQVVPFALEEHLAADVEDLHFAVGKRDARPGTPVAVVSHARMEAWQALLADAGLARRCDLSRDSGAAGDAERDHAADRRRARVRASPGHAGRRARRRSR